MLVLTCGKFDILHAGHCALLNYAVTLALRHNGKERAELVVGIVSDKIYQQSEGKAPIFSENERAEQVESYLRALHDVSKGFEYFVLLYNTPTAVPLINEYNPDCFVKGSTSHSFGLMREKSLCTNKGIMVITYRSGLNLSSELVKEKTLFYLQEELEK